MKTFMRREEVEEFYEKELLYYTGEFLLLRGQFYFIMRNDQERALMFFRRAELIGIQTYGSMDPSMIKLLIKIRLMLSKIEQSAQNWTLSLELLWKNINLLKMEAGVRMNEFMEANDTESPKMAKWCKVFITNLFQMINVFIQLEEIELSNECAKLIEWLSKCFFERKSILYISMMDFLDQFFESIGYQLGLKNEMSLLINKAIDEKFHVEDLEDFLVPQPVHKTEFGYIPTA